MIQFELIMRTIIQNLRAMIVIAKAYVYLNYQSTKQGAIFILISVESVKILQIKTRRDESY